MDKKTPNGTTAAPEDPKNATGGGQQPGEGQTGATFTQEDLDRIIGDRLTRERQKYGDYEDLKAQAAKWDAHEEAQKTELERAQAAATKAEAERDQARQEAQGTLIRAAFVAAAAKAGAAHPEDAYALADRSAVSIAADGQVTGAEAAVQALVDAGRLPLLGKPRAPKLDAGAGSGARTGDKLVELSDEELKVARKLGLTPEQYQKHKRVQQEV